MEPLSGLNETDKRAVIWAAFASQPTLEKQLYRTGACTTTLVTQPNALSEFSAAGLTVREAAVEPPGPPYKRVYEKALTSVQTAEGVARQARDMVASLRPQGFANFEPAVGGNFSGTIGEDGMGAGRIEFTAPGFEGARWEGAVKRDATGVYAQGHGVFSYAPSSPLAADCVAPRTVTFSGLAEGNQMRLGRIVFCDNSLFSGEVSSNEEPAFGRMTLVSNGIIRRLYGDFSGRNFGVGNEGVEETRRLVDGVDSLVGFRSGLWINNVYSGQ